MSTIANILHKHIDEAKKIPALPATVFLLSLKNETVSSVARQAMVTPQAGYADIKGIKKCPRFRKEIIRIFGCLPYDL